MEYTTLGATQSNVSRLGYGCLAMSGHHYGPVSDEESVRAVQRALSLGVTLFDTADVYGFGHAEEVLGRALGSRKQDVVIATKFGVRWDTKGRTRRDTSARWAAQAVEASLRRLGLDCIPLYQIHWLDHRTPLAETLEALRRLQDAGKVRYVGCCNVGADAFEEAQARCRLDTLQLPFSLLERQRAETLDRCARKHGAAILTYNSLGQGLLTGKYGADARFEGTDRRRHSELFRGENLQRNLAVVERLKVVGERHHRTPAQVAIRWLLDTDHVTCAITGIKAPTQIEENVGAFHWRLPDAEREYLTEGVVASEEGFGKMQRVAGT